jgi:D-glycero-alpha-D-manno-heptose 1-phosphate guanylyltransferase
MTISAFVLCGGLGTRLRPVLSDRPKSMAPVKSSPFLRILIEQLKAQGIEKVVLGTGYKGEQIEEYFGGGDTMGIDIRYSREHEPLGTAGALKLAENQLSDPTLILNGDTYVDWNFQAMHNVYAASDADLVLGVHTVPNIARYGSVTVDREGRVTAFVEKGISEGPGLINAGVYLLRKQIVSDLTPAKFISLEKDVFPGLLHRRLYGVHCGGAFVDIGVPADLLRAQTLLGGEHGGPE